MSEPLRVLLIGSRPPPVGGTTVLFQQLVDELSGLEGVQVECIDTQARPGRGGIALAFHVFTRTLGALTRCDVVGFHASPPGLVRFGPLLRVLCVAFRRPLVVRVFGGSLDRELDALAAPARGLLQFVLAADQLLVETEQVRAALAERFPRLRIRAHPNSRSIAALAPEPPLAPIGHFVFVGHVRPSKGVRELLTASDRVHAAGGRVELIGPLEGGIEEADFAPHPGAHWLGPLEPAAAREALAQAHALVLPTWHEGEGHPGVVLEAYAAGRPVVATRWRAIPEVVEDGVSGVLVPPRDAAALADALVGLMRDPDRHRQLAAGAWAAASRYDSRAATGRYLAICQELVSRR